MSTVLAVVALAEPPDNHLSTRAALKRLQSDHLKELVQAAVNSTEPEVDLTQNQIPVAGRDRAYLNRVESIRRAVVEQVLKVPKQKKGGFSGGGTGGGSGVACFANSSLASEARSAWQNGSAIPTALISQLLSLQLTDVYEYEHQSGIFETPPALLKPEKTWFGLHKPTATEYLKEQVLKPVIGSLSSSLLKRIEDGIDRVQLVSIQDFNPEKFNTPVQDLGITKDLPDTCAYVQVAVRHSSWTPDGGLQVDRVDLDPRLFPNLGMKDGHIDPQAQIINQAALYLHESIYLLMAGTGDTLSANTRSTVTTLMSSGVLVVPFFSVTGWGIKDDDLTLYTLTDAGLLNADYFGFGQLPSWQQNLVSEFIGYFQAMQENQLACYIAAGDDANSKIVYLEQFSLDTVPTKELNLSPAGAFIVAAGIAHDEGKLLDFLSIFDPVAGPQSVQRVCRYIEDGGFAKTVDKQYPFSADTGKASLVHIIDAATEYCRRPRN